jgi:hypothetical protein
MLTALFTDVRDKVCFELLIEDGTATLNIAAAHATQGHAIDVVPRMTDLVISRHIAKGENMKGMLGEGLKPGCELFQEGGRNDVRLSPFAPRGKRSREVLGKRLRDAGSRQGERILVIVNITKRVAREFRIVASSGVVLTSATIPVKAMDSVHKMSKKPFSARRDQSTNETELQHARAYHVHRAEEIKWASG